MGKRTVAVTGATGFVGRYVVNELLRRGHAVRALVRDRAKARLVLPEAALGSGQITLVPGDATDAARVGELVGGCDACVHLIGIIREASGGQTFERVHVGTTRRVLEACAGAGVRRYVHMSALGVREEGSAAYQKTKWAAEGLVRSSGLDWTIFRPGLIHGPEGEFTRLAVGWVRAKAPPFAFIPYFKRPKHPMPIPAPIGPFEDPRVQPVAVEDVAYAFAEALERGEAVGETYNLVGSESMTWPEMLAFVGEHTPEANRSTPIFGIPGDVAAINAKLAGLVGLGSLLPFDEGMALMGMEDSVSETGKVGAHLGLRPRPFRETFRSYAPLL